MKVEFETGDIVFLKSGGPAMTVSDPLRPPGTELVDVQWFVGGVLMRDAFHKSCLTWDDNIIIDLSSFDFTGVLV